MITHRSGEVEPGRAALPGGEVLLHSVVDAEVDGLDWHREHNELVMVVQLADFAGSLAFVNAVGALAEEAGHHPDVEIRWGTVTLRLSTHSLGGISLADLELASRIDQLGGSHSPPR